MTERKRKNIGAALLSAHRSNVDEFVDSLSVAVSRQIERIVVLVLHGAAHEAMTVDDAIRFIEGYESGGSNKPVERLEIEVRYNNGDSIAGRFKDKAGAVEFLKTYLPVEPKVA